MKKASNHPALFAEVILPLPLPRYFTYEVPPELATTLKTGIRVEVPFGKNRLYSALVANVHTTEPQGYSVKSIISIIDDEPVITKAQLAFWDWVASYYCCTLGEVLVAAMPTSLRLSSETLVMLSHNYDGDTEGLNDKEYLLAEALTIQSELTIEEVRGILQQKTVFPLIKRLLDKGILYLHEELKAKYKPKFIACVKWTKTYEDPQNLGQAFELTQKSAHQQNALLAFVQINKQQGFIKKQELMVAANIDSSVIAALEKKGILEVYERTISRLGTYDDEVEGFAELSLLQIEVKKKIEQAFDAKKTVLLHGVTGSGKTNIYVDLIKDTIAQGKQVLYLLPEIALTTQIVVRLQKVFGNDILVYHSRLNNSERVEIWFQSMKGKPIILGARSALFLPFSNLDLIIVDEEHDASYKQDDPNPRYQGRDAAIVLASQLGCRIVLGSATPSVETYYHAKNGKYELVEMFERFSGIMMPEITIVDLKKDYKHPEKSQIVTDYLIAEMKTAIQNNEQVILFQNRRGYSPNLICTVCDWVASCPHCDVALTYHKFYNHLRCHYCNHQIQIPQQCPSCQNKQLITKGYGTERIEDEIAIYFPDIPIGRMDLDTVRTKGAHARIIQEFEENRTSILVGTQMVTKGLDFENVSIVGILGADQLLYFPDFRAVERSYQIMVQAAGRAGRRKKRGKVIIQAIQSRHPIFKDIINNDYASFFEREISERKNFVYPPFVRIIQITLKHKNLEALIRAAAFMATHLKSKLNDRVKGPAEPGISKIRDYFIRDILIKLEKNAVLNQKTKLLIQEITLELAKQKGLGQLKVVVNVDP